jgi:MYXO-CTERM domain-containing protein
VTRTGFVSALFLASVATAQPATYFVAIVQRTPPNTPVPGVAPLQTSLALPSPGTSAGASILFGTGTQAPESYDLSNNLLPGGVTNVPTPADAIVTAPGVLVNGGSRTLVAVSSGGVVTFGTLESSGFVGRGPTVTIPGGRQLALSAVPDGGAALLVSDGFQITRWDLDVSSGTVQATQGFSGSAAPLPGMDDSLSLVLDGFHDIGFVGGHTIGDIYVFDASLDAGPPRPFDLRLSSAGRLTAPVTGLALYGVNAPLYLLAANGSGLTVYPLPGPPVTLNSIVRADLDAGFRVIATDSTGAITGPQGVALTNLPAGAAYPNGLVVLGDPTTRRLAVLSWSTFADGGVQIDLTDPRGGGGGPDGGCPDGGTVCPPPVDAGGGGGGTGGPGAPPGPGIPVDHPSSCASAAGGPALVALLAVLGLMSRRRRQRP